MRRAAVLLSLLTIGISSAYLSACAAEREATAGIEVSPVDAQSEAIVAAADQFIAGLSNEQQVKVQFEWTDDEQRQNWSNFPNGVYGRAGVRWGDLNETQRSALMKMLGAVLSPAGVEMVREQMQADDYLKANPGAGGGPQGSRGGGAGGPPPGAGRGPTGGGGPSGGGGPGFGSDEYYVSFVGTPSATKPWMLQFGGHHLAINATIAGGNVTLFPTLTGGQPLRFTTPDGKQLYLTKDEIDAAHTLMASLNAQQRETAIVGEEFINLVAGPQQDNVPVEAEGLGADELDKDQQDRLMALILTRLDILNDDDRGVLMERIRAGLAETTFGWWGPAEPGKPAYWRIVGPGIVIEYSPQSMGDDGSNHAHNMIRDPRNDYGIARSPT